MRDWHLRTMQIDVLGVVALLALAAMAYVGLLRPQSAQSAQYEALALEVGNARSQVGRARDMLRRMSDDERELRRLLEDQLQRAPAVSDLNAILNEVVRLAEQHALVVSTVMPGSPVQGERRATCDVKLSAEGRCVSFISFLDELARTHPYHAVRSFSLARAEQREEGICAVSLELQIFLLPDEARAVEESP